MDKSRICAIFLSLALVSTQCWSVALDPAFDLSDRDTLKAELLAESEMAATEGELAPAAIFLLGLMFTTAEAGIEVAIEQHKASGEIKAGPVVAAALERAAVYSLAAGAVWTAQAVVIVTVLGAELAFFAARKFAEDPASFDRPVGDLSGDYLLNYHDPELFAVQVGNYELGYGIPLDMDLVPLGAYVTAYPTDPGTGYLPPNFGFQGVATGGLVITGLDPFGGIGDVGAGDSHYRYF